MSVIGAPSRYARIARETVEVMGQRVAQKTTLGQSLIAARENTVHYKEEDTVTLAERPPTTLHTAIIEVSREDTLVAAKRLRDEGYESVCVLNFADAFAPGGLFLAVWCIKEQPYYERNRRADGSRGLFLHDILYSPQVPVFRGLAEEDMLEEEAVYPIGIVTSPAPQASWAANSCTQEELSDTIRERIRRILAIMANHEHDAIVLGAFGCGAFTNNPETVAAHFNNWLQGQFKGYFNKVVFGVYEREGAPNLTAFREVIQTE